MMEGAVMEYIKAFLGMIVGALVIVAVIFLFRLNEINTFQQEVNYQIERNGGLTDDAKNAMFDIPYQILNANGPHSEETAIWMARQEKAALRTDYAIAVTRDSEKHTFWIAMVDNENQVNSCPLSFYRTKNAENKAFQKALNLIQQAIEK